MLPSLRIAHLFQSTNIKFSDSHAVQLHILYTIRGLQQRGHRVSLLALQKGRRVLYTEDLKAATSDQLLNCHFGELGVTGRLPFKLFESGIRRIQAASGLPYLGLFDSYRLYDASCRNLQGYDLIHERYNLLAIGGALASRRLGIPFVLETNADVIEQRVFRGTPDRGVRRLYAVWAARFCFNTAAKIICVSSELKDHLVRKWKIDASKLAVLPCAADVEMFGQAYDPAAVRRRLGLTTEAIAMWVGGFYPWHDLDLLVDSFQRVLERVPTARLILVGDGPTRPLVERKILAAGLQEAVLLTGSVDHEQVAELLSIADVAVAPSPSSFPGHGGTPLKLFEYMAAGKAIVATGMSQARAVIRDGYNGLTVEPEDVTAFANAILRVFNDPDQRERLSQNARQQAIAQFSWTRYAERLEQIYADVLAGQE